MPERPSEFSADGGVDMNTGAEFRPYIPPERIVPEFTPKAVIIGVLFGIIFGASTVYLALKAGLTVSASIPIAVLAISLPNQKPGPHYTLALDIDLAAFLKQEVFFQPALDHLGHLDLALHAGGLHA